jgi:hypothetical protein
MIFKLLTATTLFLTIGTALSNIANAENVTTKPVEEAVKITQKNDIAYELHGCMRKSNTLSCTLVITSEVKDNKIFIATKNTRFIDLNGNEYFSNSAKVGNQFDGWNGIIGNNFIQGVPLKASIKFDNIPQNVNNFAILDLGIKIDSDTNVLTNIRFDKISIAQEPVNTTNISGDSNDYNYQNVPVDSEPVSVTDSLNSVKDTVNGVRQNVNTVKDILNIFR